MDDAEEVMDMSLSGSSIGEAVWGRGENVIDEEEGLYYIPERRPSLDLGPASMDTSHWFFEGQVLPPAQSYTSMTSEDLSMTEDNDEASTRVQLHRADSYSSCYSFDSDDCEKRTPKIRSKEDASESTDMPVMMPSTNEFDHPSVTVAFSFKTIVDSLVKLSKGDLQTFKGKLWKFHPEIFTTSTQNIDLLDLVDRLLECYGLQRSLQITKNLLVDMGQKQIVDNLQKQCLWNEVRYDVCEILRKKYGGVCEDLSTGGEKRSFDEVYADLCISSCGDIGPNIEHEVMTIGKLHTNTRECRQLALKDIYNVAGMEQSETKLVLLTGVAGSGKTTAVQKLILDWIEKRSHQHVTFLFPFTFRELKQFESVAVSLLSIVQEIYPPTQRLTFEDLTSDDCTVMFIFDGLDEYNNNLDFFNTELYGAFPEPTSLDVILVNLLRARLLFRGLFLVTSRSQVKHSVPWDSHFNELQLQGFCDSEKDTYFMKRFKDPVQANRVVSHVRSLKTLHVMCHLPLFCSLVGDECQRAFRERGTQAKLPGSLAHLYTKLLLALLRERRSLRVPERSPDDEREFVMNVGKMAYTMLRQSMFRISKGDDWDAYGLDEEEVVDDSGLCTQFLIKVHILYKERAFSFIHPTVQEYMAALYVFLSFTNCRKIIFEQQPKVRFKSPKVTELLKSAVDTSLQCEDGKLDIFLRFLFGFLVKSNLELLGPLCTSTFKWPDVIRDAAALIGKKLGDNTHPNRMRNLQCCLQELGL